jgi:HPt (histidine-containing phosphotransfer) domain-containing protein
VVRVSRVLAPLYPQFLAIQKRHVEVLTLALAQDDPETAGRLAHTVKGAAGTYELPAAAAIACDLETAVATGDLGRAGRLLDELSRYFAGLEVVFTDPPPLPDA